jgi:hypothetical protein
MNACDGIVFKAAILNCALTKLDVIEPERSVAFCGEAARPGGEGFIAKTRLAR